VFFSSPALQTILILFYAHDFFHSAAALPRLFRPGKFFRISESRYQADTVPQITCPANAALF
jgi:hypothetical protein